MYKRSDVLVFMIVFVFSVRSLSFSFPLPGRLSAGRFLPVGQVQLKVSSC